MIGQPRFIESIIVKESHHHHGRLPFTIYRDLVRPFERFKFVKQLLLVYGGCLDQYTPYSRDFHTQELTPVEYTDCPTIKDSFVFIQNELLTPDPNYTPACDQPPPFLAQLSYYFATHAEILPDRFNWPATT